MSSSIQGDGAAPKRDITGIHSKQDIEKLKKSSEEVKNSAQLDSIFNKLDTNGDGILQAEEGSVYYFSDGTISGMKDGKMISGATASGMLVDVDESGNKKTTTTHADGAVSEYVYNDKNEVQYKKYTKDGKQYLLSSRNTKMAQIEQDGSLRTTFQIGDSFEGTLIRLGLNPSDAEVRQAMEEANPKAANRKRFTLDDGDGSMQVVIPKSIMDKYDVKFNGPTLSLALKASEQYAQGMEAQWTSSEVSEGIPDPFKK